MSRKTYGLWFLSLVVIFSMLFPVMMKPAPAYATVDVTPILGGILSGTETRITTDLSDQMDPAISGDIIVYTDYRGADANIWYYDLAASAEQSVTTAGGDQVLNDVSDGIITYDDYSRGDIFIYNTATGINTNITGNLGQGSCAQEPAIGGTLLAWAEGGDIYAKDLATGEERQITASPASDRAVAVGGGIIVWQSCYPTCHIYAYDWATGILQQITNIPRDDRDPDTNGQAIVYSGRPATGGAGDIYYFDLTTGEEKRLLLDADQTNPNISGDYVAFEDLSSGRSRISVWHVPTGCVFDLGAVPTTADQFLNDIDGNRIVYTDDREGQYDIYLFTFNLPTYTITATAGTGGSISPSGAVTVNIGDIQTFTIATDTGYSILDVVVDGASVGAVLGYTFPSVTADHTIAASFAIKTYTITATAGAGGSIDPSGDVIVNYGADQTFTIATDTGYSILDVMVDGASVGAVPSYTFPSVADDHTIAASFTGGVSPIVVTSPNGGENWEVFSVQTITWSSTGVSGPVKIELSRDGGTTWATIIPVTKNDGSQRWIVLRGATTQARIKVSSISNPALFDISDANFTIVEPSITVTYPNGGESWEIGSTQTITWDSTSVLFVKIELSRDGGATWTTIAASIANHGDKTWKVTGPATAYARIRVVSLSSLASDISNADFMITTD